MKGHEFMKEEVVDGEEHRAGRIRLALLAGALVTQFEQWDKRFYYGPSGTFNSVQI